MTKLFAGADPENRHLQPNTAGRLDSSATGGDGDPSENAGDQHIGEEDLAASQQLETNALCIQFINSCYHG